MQVFKFFILFLIFIVSTVIGNLFSKRYLERVKELKQIKNALNILKTKIKFTYETLPEIFDQLSKSLDNNIGSIFYNTKIKLNEMTIEDAWKYGIDNTLLTINEEDKNVLKDLGKLLR